jgi:tetratricopeptide (TPR) repeat protein
VGIIGWLAMVYWPAFHGEFVWDDTILVKRNPLVTGELTLATVWFHTDFPLTIVALWLQWLAFGDHAAGYHIINVSFHAIATLVLWRVLVQLSALRRSSPSLEGRIEAAGGDAGGPRVLAAWAGALLFAIHPVAAASAGWISEQKNTLSLIFYLASVSGFLIWLKSERGVFRGWSYGFSVAFFLLALLSKTSTVMLPVTLLLLAWGIQARPVRRLVLAVTPFFLLSLVFGLMTIWFQHHQTMTAGAIPHETWVVKIAMAAKAIWFYLGKALLPMNLSMIYPLWHFHGPALLEFMPLLGLGIGLLMLWFIRSSGCGKNILIIALLFIANLTPALGLVDMYYLTISRVSDHFQYLSLPFITGGIALCAFQPRWKRFGLVALCVVALAFSALTFQRVRILSRDETLWTDTLRRNPDAWTAHNNLGCIRAEQGRMDEAMSHFNSSLRLNPQNAATHANLGRALALQKDFSGAETQLEAALAIKPSDAELHEIFARILLDEGKHSQALEHLQIAVSKKQTAELFVLIGSIFQMNRDTANAEQNYRLALQKNPRSAEALNNLAWLLATSLDPKLRNGAEAVACAEAACRLANFQSAQSLGTLAAAYAEAGRFSEATETAGKAAGLAEAKGDKNFAGVNRQLQRLYQAGKPFHQ